MSIETPAPTRPRIWDEPRWMNASLDIESHPTRWTHYTAIGQLPPAITRPPTNTQAELYAAAMVQARHPASMYERFPEQSSKRSDQAEHGRALLEAAKKTKPNAISSALTDMERLNIGLTADPRVLINSFCEEHQFPLFANQDVGPYMDRIIKAERVRAGQEWLVWYWRDLFGKNHEVIPTHRTTQYRHMAQNGAGMRPPYLDRRDNVLGAYDKPIPVNILGRAKALRDTYGPAMEMHVTDYGVSDSDPFIRGRFKCYEFIFGYWDEPGFGLG